MSLIVSNILKIFQSTVFGTGVRTVRLRTNLDKNRNRTGTEQEQEQNSTEPYFFWKIT